MQLRLVLGLVLAGLSCAGADLTADRIMAQVALNQDKAVELRKSFVYRQHVVVATRHFNGKLAREEKADYELAPGDKGVERKLASIAGRYQRKNRYIDFHESPVPEEDSLDGGLVKGFRDDLLSDKSKDGVGKDLFPLTSEEQKRYRFELLNRKQVAGRDTYVIRFSPLDQSDIGWAGEAWIDAEELQPARVFTQLSKRMPFMVRTLLGTDLPGIGFNVEYRRVEKDVWFPVSFGSEFRLKAVFFIKRDIMVSMDASGFKQAQVETKVQYDSAN